MDVSQVPSAVVDVNSASEERQVAKEVKVDPIEREAEEREQTGALLKEFTGKGNTIDVSA
jgi:hypothetical protein